MLFSLEQDGSTIVGSFAAQILSLTVTAGEAAGQGAKASYVLGIGRHTSGSWASSRLLLTDNGNRPGIAGDHTTPERQAWDGVNDIELEVPEPATLALLTIGATALMRRQRSRTTR